MKQLEVSANVNEGTMRPKIICHMMSSVDGRLVTERWSPPAAGIDKGLVSRVYEEVAGRLSAQGWVVGRTSMAPIAEGAHGDSPIPANNIGTGDRRTTFLGHRDGRDVAVAVDPSGKLRYGSNGTDNEHFVAVLGEGVSDAYLDELRSTGVSYLFAGPDGDDLASAMTTLTKDFGVDRLLLEGGGITNGTFLKGGLIDELSLLVFPGIDGLAGISSIFEYHGEADALPAAGKSLRLISSEVVDGGIVWLRYGFENAPRA